MPTQRRFEGPTLPAVLGKVQEEIGTQAKIVSAQKIRSGGVGGFFQKERYEVIVDIDENAAAQPAADESLSTQAQEQGAEYASQGQKVPTSLLDLAEAVNNNEQGSPATPKDASDDKWASANNQHGEAQHSLSTESEKFAEILSRVAFQADLQSSNSEEVEQLYPAIPGRPSAIDTQSNEYSPAPVRTRITDSPLAKLGLPAQYIPANVDGARLNRALVNSLQALPQAPTVRPTRGSVIAVVGERNEAMELASNLCEKWDQPTENIVLASQATRGRSKTDVVRTVRNAEDSRRSWSRRKKATIVAIEAEPGSKDVSWAEHMLTAFEPIATYGVADATRKSEDISQWAQSLGGVDSLAVINADKTQSPAAILDSNIPVDRIDGHKATPAYWAMLLMDRLNA